MESPQLIATTRDLIGKKVSNLRKNGQTPVVLYGQETDNRHLAVDSKNFSKLAQTAGSSTLVDLIVDDAKPVKVLIQDTQYEPLTGKLIHADLFQVKMSEKLQTEIPLNFIGESPAVKDLDGNLITAKDALNIEAYPQDLVSQLDVDISTLATFDDKITVADITVPSAITVLDDPEETVAVVTPPRSDEELEAELAETSDEAEAAAIAATEEASGEKKEEEEAAE